MHGPGGFTSQSMRDAWHKRVQQGLPWGSIGGNADNTEAAERIIAIAVRYALTPGELARSVTANTALTQTDGTVMAMTTAFGAVLGMLVEGHRLDGDLSDKLMARVKTGELPFHTITQGKLEAPSRKQQEKRHEGLFASPDALLTPSCIARAAHASTIRIEPASTGGPAVRPAVCGLPPVPGRLLSGGPLHGRLRVSGTARDQRRRPEHGPRHANRRPERRYGGAVGDSANGFIDGLERAEAAAGIGRGAG